MSESILDYVGNPERDIDFGVRTKGVMTAIVTNSKDPEKQGRVKVNFPWLAENSESDWIRVASFMGGSSRGSFFLPEVDDEVLIAFEHGEIDVPYVIGGLWSSKDKPPEENADGKNNIKQYKSRSGHTLTFNDNSTESKELIEIKTNAGHTITMDDSSSGPKIEIIDKTGSNKMTIDSNSNDITIESALALNLKAVNIKIEASGNLEMKGAIVKANADATMNLEASGITVVKGSLVQIN